MLNTMDLIKHRGSGERAGLWYLISTGQLCLSLWMTLPGIALLVGGITRILLQPTEQSLPATMTLGMGLFMVAGGYLVLRDKYGLVLVYVVSDLGLWILSLVDRREMWEAEEAYAELLSHGLVPVAAIIWSLLRYKRVRGSSSWLITGAVALISVIVADLPGLGGRLGAGLAEAFSSRRPEVVPAAGDQLPPLSFRGRNHLMEELSDPDMTYIVNFWATWCGPCLRELPELMKMMEDAPKEVFVRLICVNTEDIPRNRLDAFLKGVSLQKLPVYTDPEHFRDYLGVRSLPTTIVIRDRRLIARFTGYSASLVAELKQQIWPP